MRAWHEGLQKIDYIYIYAVIDEDDYWWCCGGPFWFETTWLLTVIIILVLTRPGNCGTYCVGQVIRAPYFLIVVVLANPVSLVGYCNKKGHPDYSQSHRILADSCCECLWNISRYQNMCYALMDRAPISILRRSLGLLAATFRGSLGSFKGSSLI